MQVLSTTRPDHRQLDRAEALVHLFGGVVFLLGALLVAYLALATPLVDRLLPTGRPGLDQVLAGMGAWTFLLLAPAIFGLIGAGRVATAVVAIVRRDDRRTPAARHAKALPDDYTVAPQVVLPDGRMIPELVVGPFGVAVIEELPPARAIRRHGSTWELRLADGRWRPIQHPLDRASRDAESVRRWIAHDDRDFVVKVYAAVVGPAGNEAERTASCAMLAYDQVPAWLGALPAQKTLTPARRKRLVEMVAAAV